MVLLSLEDCFKDSPIFRGKITETENHLVEVEQCLKTIYKSTKSFLESYNEYINRALILGEALGHLGKLESSMTESFPIDESNVLCDIFLKIILDKRQECRQLEQSFLGLLEDFLKKEFESQIKEPKRKFERSFLEFRHVNSKFMSKCKIDDEENHQDSNLFENAQEVAEAKRTYHISSMDYVEKLDELMIKKDAFVSEFITLLIHIHLESNKKIQWLLEEKREEGNFSKKSIQDTQTNIQSQSQSQSESNTNIQTESQKGKIENETDYEIKRQSQSHNSNQSQSQSHNQSDSHNQSNSNSNFSSGLDSLNRLAKHARSLKASQSRIFQEIKDKKKKIIIKYADSYNPLIVDKTSSIVTNPILNPSLNSNLNSKTLPSSSSSFIIDNPNSNLNLHSSSPSPSSISSFKSGYLYKKSSHTVRPVWSRRFFEITPNFTLQYYGQDGIAVEIDLRLCKVRIAEGIERRFSFEIISPIKTYYLQAENDLDMTEWMEAIQEASQQAILYSNHRIPSRIIEGNSNVSIGAFNISSFGNSNIAPSFNPSDPSFMINSNSNSNSINNKIQTKNNIKNNNENDSFDPMTRIETRMQNNLLSHSNNDSLDSQVLSHSTRERMENLQSLQKETKREIKRNERGKEKEIDNHIFIHDPSNSFVQSSSFNENSSSSSSPSCSFNLKRLQDPLAAIEGSINESSREELMRIPGNDKCADCRSPNPEWASLTFGILICIECSGIHRSLIIHKSKVKSLRLDFWESEQIDLLLELGNVHSWNIFEFTISNPQLANQSYNHNQNHEQIHNQNHESNNENEERIQGIQIENDQRKKKPTPSSPHSVKEEWILAKYEFLKFLPPSSILLDSPSNLSFDSHSFPLPVLSLRDAIILNSPAIVLLSIVSNISLINNKIMEGKLENENQTEKLEKKLENQTEKLEIENKFNSNSNSDSDSNLSITPLSYAVKLGAWKSATLLILWDANPEIADSRGYTVIHHLALSSISFPSFSSINSSINILSWILRKSPDLIGDILKSQSRGVKTPFQLAMEANNVRFISLVQSLQSHYQLPTLSSIGSCENALDSLSNPSNSSPSFSSGNNSHFKGSTLKKEKKEIKQGKFLPSSNSFSKMKKHAKQLLYPISSSSSRKGSLDSHDTIEEKEEEEEQQQMDEEMEREK